MKHLNDLLEMKDRHELAEWVQKFGLLHAKISESFAFGFITVEQWSRYRDMLHLAFINKFF